MKANVWRKSYFSSYASGQRWPRFFYYFPMEGEKRLRQIVLLGNMLMNLFHDPLFHGNRFRRRTEAGGFKPIFWNTQFQILVLEREKKELAKIFSKINTFERIYISCNHSVTQLFNISLKKKRNQGPRNEYARVTFVYESWRLWTRRETRC